MNQLKLLNFHKMIANFANNLVGAFVGLIVYQTTNSLPLAIAYFVLDNLIKLIFVLCLRKLYGKYPQLFLLLRIIPITLYNVFIFVLDYNFIVALIGIVIFKGMDNALNGLSKEIIFNYASLTKKQDNSSIGITRLFEQIGTIIALLVGGFLLDFNKTLVLGISLTIYLISVIPLVKFYIKSRKQKTFNKDATSNAVSTLSKTDELKKESKRLSKQMLIRYYVSYFCFAFVDLLTTTYALYVFTQQGEFSTAGILNAVYNSFYAIGFYLADIINEKKDTTKIVSVAGIVIALCLVLLPFIPINELFIVVCIVYGLIAFCSTFLSLFCLDRLLTKSRIMGCSNKALFTREIACDSAYCIGYAFGFLGLLGIFFGAAFFMFSSAFVIPINEEKTRQHLVDYLQNNEKINSIKMNTKAKRIAASQKRVQPVQNNIPTSHISNATIKEVQHTDKK